MSVEKQIALFVDQALPTSGCCGPTGIATMQELNASYDCSFCKRNLPPRQMNYIVFFAGSKSLNFVGYVEFNGQPTYRLTWQQDKLHQADVCHDCTALANRWLINKDYLFWHYNPEPIISDFLLPELAHLVHGFCNPLID